MARRIQRRSFTTLSQTTSDSTRPWWTMTRSRNRAVARHGSWARRFLVAGPTDLAASPMISRLRTTAS